MKNQPDVVVRVSATTDAVTLSDEVVINSPDRNHYKFRQLIGETDLR